MKDRYIFFGGKYINWMKNIKTFTFNGKKYKLFCHTYNCGWPPYRMTERSVELAIADKWLENNKNVIEIGAVTPYYWPHRIKDIVDPTDTHKLINIKKTLCDINLTGKNILSLSTIEHIGNREYGLEKEPELALQAFEKIIKESKHSLITIPVGYNLTLDAYIFNRSKNDINIFYLARGNGRRDNDWKQVAKFTKHQLLYGIAANGLIVITK